MFKTNFATEMFTICRVHNQNQTIKNCPKMLHVKLNLITILTLRKPSLLFQSVSFEAISMNGE